MNDEEDRRYEAYRSRRIVPRRFVSLVQQLHRQTQQRRAEADHEKPHEAALVTVTRRLVTATYVLAFIAACSLIAAVLQWNALSSTDERIAEQVSIMSGQLGEMRKSYGPLKDTAEAAKEQATQNRARIWIDVNGRAIPTQPGPYVGLELTFSITNYGPSPAIIIRSEFHLFWTRNEPDPLDPVAQNLHEIAVWPPDRSGEIIPLDGAPIKSINANSFVTLKKVFHFMPEGDYRSMQTQRVWEWFYGAIIYKDVYDISRETGFYGRPTGGISNKYSQYNYHH